MRRKVVEYYLLTAEEWKFAVQRMRPVSSHSKEKEAGKPTKLLFKILFYLFGGGERERERGGFHLLFHFANCYNAWD